jgi:superfamily I DNA and/or RNA helicase
MEFDFCIIDEASKATATETLVPMSKARRVVLVGDSNQLPPNDEALLENPKIMANHGVAEADVRTTLFDLLKNRLPKTKKATLVTQWRMSKAIGDLISDCFYQGKLVSVNDGQIAGYSNLIGKQVRWLDTSNHPKRLEHESRGGGYSNPVEARVIANEVVRISKAVASRHIKVDLDSFEVLIVSPYRAQKRTILNELQIRDYAGMHVRVETADAVQGSEADVVIVATTRSNSLGKMGFLGMAQWRRINVALSRAKFGLIIVGDSSFIGSTQGGLSAALDYIRSNPETCSMEMVADNV